MWEAGTKSLNLPSCALQGPPYMFLFYPFLYPQMTVISAWTPARCSLSFSPNMFSPRTARTCHCCFRSSSAAPPPHEDAAPHGSGAAGLFPHPSSSGASAQSSGADGWMSQCCTKVTLASQRCQIASWQQLNQSWSSSIQ